MNAIVKGYLGSRKVRAMLFGVAVAFAGKFGLKLDTETVAVLVSPVLTYLLAQGVADNGKEAAAITAAVDLRQSREAANERRDEAKGATP